MKNEFLNLNSNTFEYYWGLINSKEERLKVFGLQELFFSLEKGRILTRHNRKYLNTILLDIIKLNQNEQIRRWAYMVASFGATQEIVQASIIRIESETNTENRTWIVAILASCFDKATFLKQISKINHGLNDENIKLAIFMFCDYYKLNRNDISKIANQGEDIISLHWINLIAAYHNLRKRNRKEAIVDYQVISDLTEHDDNQVVEHAMGALWKKDRFCINDVRFDYFDYLSIDPDPKKWFLSALWKDENFIRNNYDYIKALLSKDHLFKYCTPKIREGFARGLTEYKYDREIVVDILQWLSQETENSVIYFLLTYAYKYKDIDSDLAEIIFDEMEHGDSNIQKLFTSIKPNNKMLKKDNNKPTKNVTNYHISIGGDVKDSVLQIGNNNVNYTNSEQRLVNELKTCGITEEQANELIAILKEEKQDATNRTLGTKVVNWCNNIKVIGLNVLSNLIFTIMYGSPPII